jgi:hypothetical protein
VAAFRTVWRCWRNARFWSSNRIRKNSITLRLHGDFARRFLNVQSATYNTFYLQLHLLNRSVFKQGGAEPKAIREMSVDGLARW